MRREKSINIFYSIISLVGIVAIHFCIRHFLDAGFHLNEQTLNSIRGEGFIQNDLQLWDQLTDIPRVLVNSALSIPRSNTLMMLFRPIYYCLIVLSIIGFIRAYRNSELNKIALIILPLIVLFMSLYVIGPFFFSKDMGTHVLFRHLTYILPLFALFAILGLRSIPKIKSLLIVLFLGIGAFRTMQLFTLEKAQYNEMIVKASGWTIGTKFGHDPKAIVEIIEKNQAQKKLLIEGVGWGISTALFERLEAHQDSLEINQRIQTLSEIMEQLPNYQPTLEEGIRFSFSDQVSPRLDTLIFARFADKAANQAKKQ